MSCSFLLIRKIGKVAEALSADRSKAVRWLLEQSLDSGFTSALVQTGRRRRITDRIVRAKVADFKAKAAETAASRDPDNVEAEIKALRTEREAIECTERAAHAVRHPHVPRPSAEGKPDSPPLTAGHAPRHRLSKAEIRAAADRAQARSENTGRPMP